MKYPMPFEWNGESVFIDKCFNEEFGADDTPLERCISIVIDRYMAVDQPEVHFVNMCWLSQLMKWWIKPCRGWYDQTHERLQSFIEYNDDGEECVRCYRGYHKAWQGNPRDHIAWTLNYATSVFFAQRYNTDCSMVATALIPLDKVVLTLAGRGEDEILINTYEDDEEFFDYLSQRLADGEDVSISHFKVVDNFTEETLPNGFTIKNDLGVTIGDVSYPNKLWLDLDYLTEEV